MSGEPSVQIHLFGALSILVRGVPQHLALAGATRSLLQYLCCFPARPVRRDVLVEQFWPSIRIDRRRAALNSAVWRIKKALAPLDGIEIETANDSVNLLIAANVEIDAVRLHYAVRQAPEALDLDALGAALEACEGPFLDGVEDDWAMIERERLSVIQMRGLTLMMRGLAERRHYEDALGFGRRILAIDPFRESTFREVMCLYVLNGQRARALTEFHDFSEALEDELGIAPMAETLALYDYLSKDNAPSPDRAGSGSHTFIRSGRRGLSDQLTLIERSRRELFRSMSGAPV